MKLESLVMSLTPVLLGSNLSNRILHYRSVKYFFIYIKYKVTYLLDMLF